MQINLRQQLMQFAHVLQQTLFPALRQELGPLDERGQLLTAILAMVPVAKYATSIRMGRGRLPKDRIALACAFLAKAVYDFPKTRDLISRLHGDERLRRLCGWESAGQIPSESKFSRAFAEFAQTQLPNRFHDALIEQTHRQRLVGHISRDSTAIEAREKVKKKAAKPEKKRRKRGRPRKGTSRTPSKRLERQRSMSLAKMLAELPAEASVGAKRNSKGNTEYWHGYKLHIDVADGQIPISCVLTSASVHDSQVAIPLITMTSQKVTHLYELMDAAYDAKQIREHSESLNHVAIIPRVERGRRSKSILRQERQPQPAINWAHMERLRERTMSERVNSRLKDEFGGRHLRVRGAAKAMAHLMYGVVALTVDQLLKFTSSAGISAG